MEKCLFNSAKNCDGLCNNCAKNIKHDENSKYKIVPAKNHWCENDYEEAILINQERNEDF